MQVIDDFILADFVVDAALIRSPAVAPLALSLRVPELLDVLEPLHDEGHFGTLLLPACALLSHKISTKSLQFTLPEPDRSFSFEVLDRVAGTSWDSGRCSISAEPYQVVITLPVSLMPWEHSQF